MKSNMLVLLGAVILLSPPARNLLGEPAGMNSIHAPAGFCAESRTSARDLSQNSGELATPFRISGVPVARTPDGKAFFGGLPAVGIPGRPALPAQTVRVLLPPDARPDSLSASIRDAVVTEIAGEWDVPPAPPYCKSGGEAVWPIGRRIQAGRDMDVYSSGKHYPDSHLGDIVAGAWREWKVVSVAVFPYRYNPVTRKLLFIEKGDLVVQYGRDGARSGVSPGISATGAAAPAPGRTRRNVLSSVVNPEAASGYDPGYVQPVPSAVTADMVILTTSSIQSNSAKLAEFKAAKEVMGLSMLIVTEGTSMDDYHYVSGSSCDQRADNIRGWLTNPYASMGIEYALLIGNPDPGSFGSSRSVPMKMCYPRNAQPSDKQSPTDMYYAELTGNWDNNTNGVYGEYADVGSGGIDMMCEVAVGRIPVYDTNTAQIGYLDSILDKTKAYELAPARSWRSNYLGSASFQTDDFAVDGAEMIEHFRTNVCVPNAWTSTRLYQQGSKHASCDSAYASDYELRGAAFGGNTNHHHYHWQSIDFGVVMWWGHGADTWTQVGPNIASDGVLFTNAHASGLDNSHPSFLFPCSCNNGYPETTNNLCVSVLRNGAIAALAPSRVTWAVNIKWLVSYLMYSDNASYNYHAARRMIEQDEPIGDAINWLHANASVSYWQDSALMNHFDFNIYGDPSVGLRTTGLRTLTVVSAHGGAWPGTVTATNNAALFQAVTNSPVAVGSTQLLECVRGVVQGNAYAQVSPTNVTLVLTNDSTLTWQWETNYPLSVMTSGYGTANMTAGWFRSYSNVSVTAAPGPNWHFAGWSGDTQGDTNSTTMILLMDRARTIQAGFATNEPAAITANPQSLTNNPGTAASFSVAATGTPPLYYQWQKNSQGIPMATSQTFTIASVAAGNAGVYRCLVSNIVNAVTSSAATLAINEPAAITGNPQSLTNNPGSTARFSVTATGTAPLHYQWWKDGVNIWQATNATCTIAPVTPGDAGSYQCMVNNMVNVTNSAAATLSVNEPAVITGNPASLTNSVETAASFSVTAAGTAPLYYQWQKNAADIALATNPSYTIASVGLGDAGGYRCLVGNMVNVATSATATLAVRKLAQTITFPAIPAQNLTNTVTLSATASSGLPVSFAVASGPGRLEAGVLSFTQTGVVRVAASQAGNTIYAEAAPVTNLVTVTGGGRAAMNDYDGNGASELAVYDNTGHWYAYSLESGLATVWQVPWGWPGAETAPGDYDGDAVSDLCVYDQNTGCWYAWNHAREELILWARPWGWPGAETAPGDYDGDAISDLAVYDQPSGYWYIITPADAVLAWGLPWGWPGAITVPGDYDGDARSDICVYDSNTGYWYAQTLAGTVLAWEQPWGWPGATTVPGDYDGDRKDDLAVYDQPSGNWYAWSQAEGQVLVWAMPWGWTGAVPVPGDYDGDRTADLAVFDTIQGYWYVWSAANNGLVAWAQPWGWPGAYPPGGRE